MHAERSRSMVAELVTERSRGKSKHDYLNITYNLDITLNEYNETYKSI
jgi:hypothetical protein